MLGDKIAKNGRKIRVAIIIFAKFENLTVRASPPTGFQFKIWIEMNNSARTSPRETSKLGF